MAGERIGTAGWSVPKTVADRFPQDGSALERYATVFPAVEINSSFYRPHRRTTYERWAASTPPDFRFSAKVPKAFTHEARLRSPQMALPAFFEQVSGLGEKLEALLVQLPPSLAFDDAAAEFLDGWRDLWSGPTVIEPRHRSWFTPAVDEHLEAARIARAAADPAVVRDAGRPGGWRGLTYLRLHGSPVMYDSAYGDAALAEAARMLAARPPETAGWCVFDNTRLGAAATDALRLLDRLR